MLVFRPYIKWVERYQTSMYCWRSTNCPKVTNLSIHCVRINITIIATSIRKGSKENSLTRLPTTTKEMPTSIKRSISIKLTYSCCIFSCICKTCKRRSFGLNKARWGRGVDCLYCFCIVNRCCSCEILVPELVAMAAAPVIILYIIEREWVLYCGACSLITTNSLPRALVIIKGLIKRCFLC